jgi:glutathione S-transferase
MSSSDLKFYYFNLQARGELTRLILAAADRSFEDVRFDFDHWPEYKPKMILGQCPVLELADGTQIPQSMAIARYVARETGLAGADNLESAKIDAVVDTQRDVNEQFYSKVFFEKDEAKKEEELKKFLSETLVKHVENLGKLKKAYSKDERYFVGNKLSWADILVYFSIQALVKAVPQVQDKVGDQFKPLVEAINANASLKKYLDNRPETDF